MRLYRTHPVIELFILGSASLTVGIIGAIGGASVELILGAYGVATFAFMITMMGMAEQVHQIYQKEVKA